MAKIEENLFNPQDIEQMIKHGFNLPSVNLQMYDEMPVYNDLSTQQGIKADAQDPITELKESIKDLATVMSGIRADHDRLAEEVQTMVAPLMKEKEKNDLVLGTVQAYTRLLLAKLASISTNKETQAKLTQVVAQIEKKFYETILGVQQ